VLRVVTGDGGGRLAVVPSVVVAAVAAATVLSYIVIKDLRKKTQKSCDEVIQKIIFSM
jgi:hypothetical protein